MNQHGLDVEYFQQNLRLIDKHINRFTPNDMFNELHRLMMRAAEQANLSVETKVKSKK